jgi:hypothetical protein
MKKFKKAIVDFIINSVNCLAPYTVRNSHFKVMHHAWSYDAAMEWLKCYDARKFGATHIYDFNGELVAYKAA